MNTETTDNNGFRGWIGYDAECGFCQRLVLRWGGVFEARGFTFVPLQNRWLAGRLDDVGRASSPGQVVLDPAGYHDGNNGTHLAGQGGLPTHGPAYATIPDEMKLLLADGRIIGGADAVAALACAVWYLTPAGWLMRLPGLRQLAAAAYRWVAANRQRLGICQVPERRALHNLHGHVGFFEMP